jgi:ATP-dependent exoDNAse (exonuclease V) beta subunit
MTSRISLVPYEYEGHWYYPDGKPCLWVPKKTKPDEVRRPTVVDAVERSLEPSVTSIIHSVFNRPQLNAWINTQYVLSALTLPRLPGEGQDDFAQRVVRDARVEAQNAADFGTNVHTLVEQFLRNEIPDTLSSVERAFLEGFMLWSYKYKIVPIDMEVCFCNPDEGYGGRVDFIGHIDDVYCIVDWKTQKTKPGEAIKFYEEWNTQLSAYDHGLRVPGEDPPRKVSVVISSTEPGRIQPFMWLDDPQVGDWGWDSFVKMRDIYYSPLGQGWKLKRYRTWG